METREIPYDPAVFEPKPKSTRGKIRCKTCFADGYPDVVFNYGTTDVGNPWWWGRSHVLGHGWDCSDCDLAFTSSIGLSLHRRKRHP